MLSSNQSNSINDKMVNIRQKCWSHNELKKLLGPSKNNMSQSSYYSSQMKIVEHYQSSIVLHKFHFYLYYFSGKPDQFTSL